MPYAVLECYLCHRYVWPSNSGVDPGGSGGSMNRGPELGPARKEYRTSEKLTLAPQSPTSALTISGFKF